MEYAPEIAVGPTGMLVACCGRLCVFCNPCGLNNKKKMRRDTLSVCDVTGKGIRGTTRGCFARTVCHVEEHQGSVGAL